ncbi:MAG: hypothetical protein COC09_09695 [Gammaproteobacteria bacterium]|nr:MAG: hypothetical protein COC09_09695 [Gammaproteobacteria bacterium]
MDSPKLFVSYSWSNPFHEQWVLELATELRESGIDVILDKWDLKEGHDAVSFMEKMVTDPEIKKVVIISDEIYANKADGRAGGVGTETQIISKEVYDNQEQNKFVTVVAQKDENGKPYLPAYYKSRIYIDLCEPDNYADNFEKLLRWIFGKPLYVRPDIGKTPSFLSDSESVSLGTTPTYKRAISAIKESRPYAAGALDEYLTVFSENLEKFRISEVSGEFDDAILESIGQFTPYRNEAIQLFFAIAHYAPNEDNISKLHRFFESLIPYLNRPEHLTNWNECGFDNFRFIIHELFLYAVAIFIKAEKFEQANVFLKKNYYLAGNSNYGKDVMVTYSVFSESMKSLVHRNERLKSRMLSIRADILEKRCKGSGLELRHIMQADFVLFMRSEIDGAEYYSIWWPETLLYVGRFHSALEIFARSTSREYFDQVKCLLNIDNPSDLNELLASYKTGSKKLPRWESDSFSPSALLGFEQLGEKV